MHQVHYVPTTVMGEDVKRIQFSADDVLTLKRNNKFHFVQACICTYILQLRLPLYLRPFVCWKVNFVQTNSFNCYKVEFIYRIKTTCVVNFVLQVSFVIDTLNLNPLHTQ